MKTKLKPAAVTFFTLTPLILLLVIAATSLIAYWLYKEDVSHHGRLYPSRDRMCYQLAIDYLRNIRNEPDFDDSKWAVAIDIETEIHKLCQLELSREAVGHYQPTALEKYP